MRSSWREVRRAIVFVDGKMRSFFKVERRSVFESAIVFIECDCVLLVGRCDRL